MPKRIQRKRTAGWRMPPNGKSVTRPGRFANPFRPYTQVSIFAAELSIAEPGHVVIQCGGVEECLAWFRLQQMALWRLYERAGEDYFAPIRGFDLACWCPLDRPCHADVLLDLANSFPGKRHDD